MKSVLIMGFILGICSLVTPAFATCPPKYNTVVNNFVTNINKTTVEETNITNIDQTQDRENQAGPGIDIVVWENEKETVSVETQTKFDVNNSHGAWSNYVVCKVNLWKMVKK